MTPAPPRIIPRGLLSESALAWIATGKYQFGMPLYRQAGLLRRFGGDISSNTIAASMVRVGLATQPVINLVRDVLLAQSADEARHAQLAWDIIAWCQGGGAGRA